MSNLGDNLCNKQDGSKSVWPHKWIEKKGSPPISSSITKSGHEPHSGMLSSRPTYCSIFAVFWSELEGREVDRKLSPFSLQVVPFVPS